MSNFFWLMVFLLCGSTCVFGKSVSATKSEGDVNGNQTRQLAEYYDNILNPSAQRLANAAGDLKSLKKFLDLLMTYGAVPSAEELINGTKALKSIQKIVEKLPAGVILGIMGALQVHPADAESTANSSTARLAPYVALAYLPKIGFGDDYSPCASSQSKFGLNYTVHNNLSSASDEPLNFARRLIDATFDERRTLQNFFEHLIGGVGIPSAKKFTRVAKALVIMKRVIDQLPSGVIFGQLAVPSDGPCKPGRVIVLINEVARDPNTLPAFMKKVVEIPNI